MLVQIEGVLTAEQVAQARLLLEQAPWVDGRVTAGHQSAQVKDNLQVPEGCPEHRTLGDMVLGALERNPLFISAVLPLRVFPPLFNRYDPGMTFGAHVDNAIRQITGTPHRIRTDVSCTLFLSDPASYDGGELIVEDAYGEQRVKLPAGDAVVYPATSLHRVAPVTRGARLASFFWVQSMVRDDGQRALLFDLDMAINRLRGDIPETHPSPVQLTSVYHNLLRRWADA
ncbi:PKHD-type hydroxylase PiuC [Siccirubricoccus deserti]|uniref:Fe2+-dependent dioxygenase n=1 Tax=Siccirubricoccus deserti TaxID=2013562 RepID=A0A9X0QUD9_9PROT|nr:Fe2+-dependent dioxygenase [Siccirubricoccus deserti]MBC4013925.1 Fe2+-dependent dioxygenase [Siccirubricoccus deserti]GGC30577.1 PKHD-type hydroxylase PiuC [Siccirubricoccus deserti]